MPKAPDLTLPGEFIGDQQFPLSVDYVKGWTSPRAVAEIISNAIDADPNFTVEYRDGVLHIIDNAEGGVGASGMVLGHTTKADRADLIGQFGEGLKIGLLVLLRDPTVHAITVDTVGYAFTAMLTQHSALAELGLGSTDQAPQVMTWRIHRSQRVRGTHVRIACTPKLAQAATSRFLNLADPNYVRPTTPRAIAGMKGGSVFIGGVLVSERKSMTFSYDLPLAMAKGWQNRDRTVLDSWQLQTGVNQALADADDPALVRQLADATLSGKLSSTEQGWVNLARHSSNLSASTRRAWAQEGKRRWPTGKVFYRPSTHTGAQSYDESILDLQDRGYVEMTAPALNYGGIDALAELLGVRKPTAASQHARTKGPKTTWAKSLTPAQQEVLDAGIDAVRQAWGPQALDKVKVFTHAGVSNHECPDLEWNGFYEPATGLVAVGLSRLTSLEALLPTLVHEAGHRLAHRDPDSLGLGLYSEHADRTRGFERTLHTMAARVLLALATGATLADMSSARQPGTHPDFTWVPGRRGAHGVCRTAFTAAELVTEGLHQWADANNVPHAKAAKVLCEREYLRPSLMKSMLNGDVGINTTPQQVAEIAAALGLDGQVLWWAQVGVASRFELQSDGTLKFRQRSRPRNFADQLLVTMKTGPNADLVEDLSLVVTKDRDQDAHWLRGVDALLERASAAVAQQSQ